MRKEIERLESELAAVAESKAQLEESKANASQLEGEQQDSALRRRPVGNASGWRWR